MIEQPKNSNGLASGRDQPINRSTDQLINYCLQIADNSLVLGHRNSEWTGHGPILEQDIALSNIALDLIGQARNFYQYAAELIGNKVSEDSLAYLRDAHEFRNCLLAELPNGDWGKTITRQFFFSVYQWLLYTKLQNSSDKQVAGISEKALKEVTYHLRWSSEWMIRLGDGTDESHSRMKSAVVELWPFTGELITAADYEIDCSTNGIAIDPSSFANQWKEKVSCVFSEAGLTFPADQPLGVDGKTGNHTEHLVVLLKEMQMMQRTYPGNEW